MFETIDIDDIPFPHPPSTQGAPRLTSSTPTTKTFCVGIHLTFPPGRNHHTSYPFGLHNTLALPWDYHSVADRFFLQSTSCKKQIVMSHHGGSGDNIHACHSCESIRTNEHFESIVDRINVGIHLNSTLAYQPIDGLVQLVRKKNEQIEAMHLTKLNDDRKLQTRNASLADHKQWMSSWAYFIRGHDKWQGDEQTRSIAPEAATPI